MTVQTEFATSVQIARPIEDVFAYLADPANFAHWNSAVRAVRPSPDRPRSYTMERVLPRGPVRNGLEVFARERPSEFGIRTTSGPTPFSYRYRLSEAAGETVVRLDAEVEIDGAPALLGSLVAGAVKRGVDANFATLKRTLEGARPAAGPR